MKLKFHAPHSSASLLAFTMIEIAIALAVIGFALVAIIGVLPFGMNVQKENREQTIVNLDAAYLMDLLRGGARGQDSLTNHVFAITNISVFCDTNGIVQAAPAPQTNWFTTNQTYVNGALLPFSILTNGSNIVGLLSTPKYVPAVVSGVPGFFSNVVTADMRALSGPAVDLGASQSSREFAFSYRVTIEVMPTANYPYAASNANWVNVTAPGLALFPDIPEHAYEGNFAQSLQTNLSELRLRFRWPVLGSGQLGSGRLAYRSAGGGSITNQDIAPGGAALRLYFLKPQSFVAAPLP